jgi:hypothetical protein
MTLNIMTLEAQLLAEIKERQEKLNKVRELSPKLQSLEALLKDCKDSCDEFGMTDLFTSLLGSFTGTPIKNNPNPTPTPQPQTNTAASKLSDKGTKTIRQELKTFLEYEGQRLNDVTAKELLIKKLEELNKTELLAEVNLDDKESFLVEAKKLINLLTPTPTDDSKEEEVKEETLTHSINHTFAVQVTVEEVKEIEGLDPLCVIKSTLVQNSITGSYGTVEQDGILNGGALVRYPYQETLLTPLTELVLIQSALPIPIVLEVLEEEIKEEEEEEIKDMTPQEKMMWDALLAADFTPEELTEMSTDKETVDGYNSTNGTNLTSLPIAELYEYTMGVGRIE